ncbi:MAG TPA: hypothetical protein VI094_13375 [Propionibacteriaceae bacterium]
MNSGGLKPQATGLRDTAGVVSLIHFTASFTVLAARAELNIWAENAAHVENGLQLVDELNHEWGPDGRLASLIHAAHGTPVEVSWDTLLLLVITDAAGLTVDLQNHSVTRVGPVELPSAEIRRGLIAELLLQELRDAGCPAGTIAIGDYTSAIDGVRPDELCHRPTRT